ncbi:tsr1, partial [Symbiodinium sp. CCMP2592]
MVGSPIIYLKGVTIMIFQLSGCYCKPRTTCRSDTTMATTTKKQNEARKFVTRYFHTELGAETKLFPAITDEEAKAMVRAVAAATPKELTWRAGRGYMLAQEAEYSPSDGSLSLRGYVRGPGLRCRHLAHLTGHGDFVVERISTCTDPC